MTEGRNRKKVLLLAYTNKNFGDDLFVKTICSCFPDIQFEICAPSEYNNIFSQVPNLTILNNSERDKWIDRGIRLFPSLTNLINYTEKKYAAVVYTIGALFDDNEIWSDCVKKLGMQRAKNMLWKYRLYTGVPFFLLGCNMSRVKSKEYIEQMKYMFDGLYDICFRDKYSYDFFSDLPNTRFAPDIVFNYECKTISKDNLALISVWGPLINTTQFPQWRWAEKLWEPYRDFLICTVKNFINRGVEVILLSLCENEGDLEACYQVKSKGNFDDNIKIFSYDGLLDSTVELFERAKYVVGSRFHSIVMGINAQCKIYPVVYESKTEQLLNDLNFTGPIAFVEKPESYRIEKYLDNDNSISTVPLADIKKNARRQFSVLWELLYNSRGQ